MSPDAPPVRISDADLARLFAYLDDELGELEALAFELRLSEESELARAYERLQPADELQRRLHSRASRRGAAGRVVGERHASWRGRWWGAAAVVLLIGVAGYSAWRSRPAPTPSLVAAALPFERQLMDEAVRQLGPEAVPGGLRASQGAEAPDPRRLVADLRGAVDERARMALRAARTGAAAAVHGAYYALVAEVDRAATGVVIELVPGRAPRLAAADGARSFALTQGAATWVPAPPVGAPEGVERVPEEAWRRPFLVPRGTQALRAILAVRAGELPEHELEELTAHLSAAEPVVDPDAPDADAVLVAWLRSRGYATRSFVVHEPR